MRIPEPFWREGKQAWYIQLGKRQRSLGKDEKKARTKANELVREYLRKNGEELEGGCTLHELIDAYANWILENRAASNYEVKQYFLRDLKAYFPSSLNAEALKPITFEKFLSTQTKIKSPTTKRDRITWMIGIFNWGIRYGVVKSNPLNGMERPTARVRQDFIPAERFPEFFEAISPSRSKLTFEQAEEIRSKNGKITHKQLAEEYGVHIDVISRVVRGKLWSTPAERSPAMDFFTVMLESGARTQEMFKATAKNFDGEKFTFIIEDSKGKKRSRVVFLPDRAKEIVARLAAENPRGPIFLNTEGKPWNKDNLNSMMRQLKKRFNMPSLCATTLRHSFSVWRLSQGQDPLIVAKLMGHRDTRMLATRYGHLDGSATLAAKANELTMPLSADQSGTSDPKSNDAA